MVKKVKSLCLPCLYFKWLAEFSRPRSVWNQKVNSAGHSDINTTPSVIMSLFCCRSLCFCISLSRCLCPFILALSRSAWRCSWLEFSLLLLALTRSVRGVSSLKFSLFALTLFFCLPAFFTEIFSVCSNPVSFCLPAFFAEIFSVWSEIFSVCSCPVSFYLPTLFAKILSSSSTSNALSLAIVFACSTRVDSCSLLFTFSLLSALNLSSTR